MKSLIGRLYTDYLQSNRINEYREILKIALDNNYEVHSVSSFYNLIKNNEMNYGKKYFIIRHDLDSNAKFSYEFAKVEKEFGISASYYYRLVTADTKVMKGIYNENHEVGYHYEEISTIAKENGYKTVEDINQNLTEIKLLFSENLKRLRSETGLPITTIASHGDFINRKIGIKNHYFLNDDEFRRENNIELEAYDIFNSAAEFTEVRDGFYPKNFSPVSPIKLIMKDKRIIHFLSHPRYWKASPIENTIDNVRRMREEMLFK